MVDSERNSVETAAKSALWLEELQKGIDQTLELFPELDGQLSVKLRFPADLSGQGGVQDAATESDSAV